MKEKPNDPARHYLLGLCLLEMGDVDAGRQAMKRVISLAPRHAPAHLALGKAAVLASDGGAAERHLRTALRNDPDLLPAYVELGNFYAAQDRADDAVALFREALERKQDHAGLQVNYGNVLYRLGRRAAAIEAWQAALRLDPNMATAHASMGLALRNAGQIDEAIAAFERAVTLEPQVGEHRFNLAVTCFQRRRYAEASDALAAAEPLMKDARRVRVQRARVAQAMVDWDALDALMPDIMLEVEAATRGERSHLAPFASLSFDLDQPSRSAIARNHATAVSARAQQLRSDGPFRHETPAEPRDVLRIGYLSSDFGNHPMGHLIAGLFARHDRTRFQVTAYSIGPDDGSSWRMRIEQGADSFVELNEMGDAAAAERIHADGIDVLIDLNGFTARARPEIVALRPAPVQATWVGMPGTTGARFIDYVLTDRIVTPPDMQAHYEERFCYLPGCYYPYDDETVIDAGTVSRAEEGLPDGALGLACFCAHYKIDRRSFASWCEILKAVPDSVLWLLRESPEGEASLRAAAVAAGIAPDRLVFAARKPRPEHMARLALADLALDTFIYGAHTTAADVLRAGVPMVTRLGPDFASRVAASVLTGIGLSELVARDIDECTALAIALASDRERLAGLRARLAGLIEGAPIFDTTRMVRGLERAYDAMWRRHLAGEAPAPIDLSEPPYGGEPRGSR